MQTIKSGCRPTTTLERQSGKLSYGNPQFGYGFEDKRGKFTADIRFADGKHGPDRWDLSQNDPGTTEDPENPHDDYKRPMPTTRDAGLDPKNFRLEYQSQFRVPDSRAVYEQPGDQLGYNADTRAQFHGEGPLGPSDRLQFPNEDRAKKIKNLLTDR